MTLELIKIWHCDATCGNSAPADTLGWFNAVYAQCCPDHAEFLGAHKPDVTADEHGRGNSLRTTWYLRCACGWVPSPSWSSWNYGPLVKAHLQHLAEVSALSGILAGGETP